MVSYIYKFTSKCYSQTSPSSEWIYKYEGSILELLFSIFLSNILIYINSLELCSFADDNKPIQQGSSGSGGSGKGIGKPCQFFPCNFPKRRN